MSNLNRYVDMLNDVYAMGTGNHPEHNSNPRYWDLLLGDVKNNPELWKGKRGLDFGCGKGRNLTNLWSLTEWEFLHGIDVSSNNIKHCQEAYVEYPFTFFKNSGENLADLQGNTYDFVMSTIVLQHICVHELRYKLKEEIFRVLKPGGVFSFQMGYGGIEFTGHTRPRSYFENSYDAQNSNGSNDVRVVNEQDLIADLQKIGFSNITFEIHEPWEDGGHPNWIYVRCEK
jgi:SAM-dependent methyltransferase